MYEGVSSVFASRYSLVGDLCQNRQIRHEQVMPDSL